MNRDLMTLNEVLGNGIYFYREELTGLWMTFGYSAYLLSQIDGLHTLSGYSENMQMPCVCIANTDFRKMVSDHASVVECKDGYYHWHTACEVDASAYQRWTESLK
ncbi:MAG: hypothetical protein IJ494_06650 [Bacteroides sp.]|nr:hypothetical protein [Bacteroides sp.]